MPTATNGTSAKDAKALEQLELDTKSAQQLQRRVLHEILEHNAQTEYLQRHGLKGCTDEASFKACVPMITYPDIEGEIERIADGDASPILCADTIHRFSLSSGTSNGKSKLIPNTKEAVSKHAKFSVISRAITNRVFPEKCAKPLTLPFTYAGTIYETKGGLKAGTGTTLYFRGGGLKTMGYEYVSPDEVTLGNDLQQQAYCHLLCGLLRCEKVEQVYGLFAYTVVEGLRMLEQDTTTPAVADGTKAFLNWKLVKASWWDLQVWLELCEDIRQGSLSQRIVDPKIRLAVSRMLQPNPTLANFIAKECGKGWYGILQRVFPNLSFIKCICTGTMAPYVPALSHYAGKVPIVSGDYLASEGWLGININPLSQPEDVEFLLLPDSAYFEFLLADLDEEVSDDCVDKPKTQGLTEVQIGHKYELVLTTSTGLYRYCLGDIIKATGFYNSAPKFSYVRRKNTILSVNTDKTDEDELQTVMQKASQYLQNFDIEVVDFTSHADLTTLPGHYVIFTELRKSGTLDRNVLQDCCQLLDTSFNNPYMRGRVAKTIDALEFCVVKRGTFWQLLNHTMSLGSSPCQFKVPRCVTSKPLLRILNDGVLERYYSPDIPEEVLAAWRPTKH